MTNEHFRVAYFDRWQHAAGLEMMRASSAVELMYLQTKAPADEVWPQLTASHGYYIHSDRNETPAAYRADAELLARWPRLLAIATWGAGYDTVDLDACTAAGVIVANQAGGNKEAVAEHALGMMLCLSQRLIEADRALRRDRNWHRNDFIGNDLLGKTVGIIGLGNIGGRLAELCAGLFQMRILAYDPYLTTKQFALRGAEPVSLVELLGSSDFVSVHCPLTAETRNMLGAAEFALMRPNAYFITTARGGIHDEATLIQALERNQIRGAGLDVWDTEPPALDHPLLRFDNVVVTPHTGGISDESRRKVGVGAAEQWFEICRGERPARLLNPEAWPQFAARYAEIFGRPAS